MATAFSCPGTPCGRPCRRSRRPWRGRQRPREPGLRWWRSGGVAPSAAPPPPPGGRQLHNACGLEINGVSTRPHHEAADSGACTCDRRSPDCARRDLPSAGPSTRKETSTPGHPNPHETARLALSSPVGFPFKSCRTHVQVRPEPRSFPSESAQSDADSPCHHDPARDLCVLVIVPPRCPVAMHK